MKSAKYHRPYLALALLFTCLGTPLGARMLASLCGMLPDKNWTHSLNWHGQMQVYGFVVLFTMGVAHQMFHQIFGLQRGKRWIHFSLAAMTLGTLLSSLAPSRWLGPTLQLSSAMAFLGVMMTNNRGPKKSPTPVSVFFLRTAVAWLVVGLALRTAGYPGSLSLQLTLWGFASLFILGVALRIHPAFLGRPTPGPRLQWLMLILWNAGLAGILCSPLRPLADLSWLVCVLIIHGSLRPLSPKGNTSPPWLRAYLALSYSWLLLTCILRLAQGWGWSGMGVDGAVRHSLASGFILTMIIGMGYRLVPAFEGRVARFPLPTLCLLAVGTLLRVAGEANLGHAQWPLGITPWAGLAQALAVLIFAVSTLATIRR